MIITIPPYKTLQAIVYRCDNCGEEVTTQWKAVLRRRQYRGDEVDLCRSCTVKETHLNRIDLEKVLIIKRVHKRAHGEHGPITINDKKKCKYCGIEYNPVIVRDNHSKTGVKLKFRSTCGSLVCRKYGKGIRGRSVENKNRSRAAWEGSNNPNFGKPPSHGKFCKIQGCDSRFRSRWEAAFALYLMDNGIEFAYESISYQLNDKQSYVPDFVIDDIIYEVKGYWRDDALVKWNIFRDKYPHIRCILVDGYYLNSIDVLKGKNITTLYKQRITDV